MAGLSCGSFARVERECDHPVSSHVPIPAAATSCSAAMPNRLELNGCFRVLCRNTARPIYAPGVPPKKASLSRVDSRIRRRLFSASVLSIPNAAKAAKLIAMSVVMRLARVRWVSILGRFSTAKLMVSAHRLLATSYRPLGEQNCLVFTTSAAKSDLCGCKPRTSCKNQLEKLRSPKAPTSKRSSSPRSHTSDCDIL